MGNATRGLTRRKFLHTTALMGEGAATTTALGLRAARAAAIELQYFYRAAWPTSEVYANWLINEWNKKNGDRVHLTGASVDGETYKTKQTIELSSSDPPDIFYSWEGGRALEIIKAGFSADLSEYYKKYGWDKSLNSASVTLATFDGKQYFVPTEIGASVVWYRKDIHDKLGLTVPKTWDELMANAAKAKAAGIAPFMLSNQKKWPSQFMWSAMLVNKHGLDTYEGLINNKIPWTDPRAVDITAMMQSSPRTACSKRTSTRSTSRRLRFPGHRARLCIGIRDRSFSAVSAAIRNNAAPCRRTGLHSPPWATGSRSCRSTTKTRS